MAPHALILVAALLCAQPAPAIPEGDGRIEVAVGKTTFEVFTYRPKNYKDGPLFVIFHGVNRNPDSYRDNAKALADRHGALVVAPLFDAQRFPTARYQQGGLLKDGKVAPAAEWTWTLVPKLVDAVRQRAGRPKMPYYLIGHSAGGQFLVRLSGFVKTDAVRIVAANPGTHLFPGADLPFPYGFGGLPAGVGGEAGLKRYLAQPLTIYLGTADIVADKNFEKSANAMKQGDSRYQRGQKCFELAKALAAKKGWAFNWQLVEAPMIGHNARGMFGHAQCDQALNPAKKPQPNPGPAPLPQADFAPKKARPARLILQPGASIERYEVPHLPRDSRSTTSWDRALYG